MEVPICFFEQVLEQCIRFLHKPRPSAATRPCPHVRKSCRSALTGSRFARQRGRIALGRRPAVFAANSKHVAGAHRALHRYATATAAIAVAAAAPAASRRAIRIPRLLGTLTLGVVFASLLFSIFFNLDSQRVLWEQQERTPSTGTGVTLCVCSSARRSTAESQENRARSTVESI